MAIWSGSDDRPGRVLIIYDSPNDERIDLKAMWTTAEVFALA